MPKLVSNGAIIALSKNYLKNKNAVNIWQKWGHISQKTRKGTQCPGCHVSFVIKRIQKGSIKHFGSWCHKHWTGYSNGASEWGGWGMQWWALMCHSTTMQQYEQIRASLTFWSSCFIVPAVLWKGRRSSPATPLPWHSFNGSDWGLMQLRGLNFQHLK